MTAADDHAAHLAESPNGAGKGPPLKSKPLGLEEMQKQIAMPLSTRRLALLFAAPPLCLRRRRTRTGGGDLQSLFSASMQPDCRRAWAAFSRAKLPPVITEPERREYNIDRAAAIRLYFRHTSVRMRVGAMRNEL